MISEKDTLKTLSNSIRIISSAFIFSLILENTWTQYSPFLLKEIISIEFFVALATTSPSMSIVLSKSDKILT
jgi:hypothetical protein